MFILLKNKLIGNNYVANSIILKVSGVYGYEQELIICQIKKM